MKTKHQESSAFIARINGKDPVGWEELYVRYYQALCAYSASFSGDAAAAEDIVQELLLKLWQSDVAFTVEPELTTYLYRAVCRNSLAYRRDRDNRTSLLKNLHEQRLRQEGGGSARSEADEEAELAAGIVEEEIIRRLYNNIRTLPTEQRRIITLSIAGMKGEEIARRLGISINTVKTQKYRGYRSLRLRLSKFFLLWSWVFALLWKEGL